MIPKLVVVGSVAYDTVETPTCRQDDVLGGSASHFSLASRLLAPTGVVAVVGEDFRSSDRQLLASKGVDLTGLETKPGKTFRWGGRYDEHLKDRTTLYTWLNVFADFSPELPGDYRNAPYLFLANIDPDLQARVLDQSRNPKWVALDTMNFWIQGKRDSLLNLLPRVHALFLNDSEAFELTGERDLRRAAAAIQRLGTPTVVIKKGEHGAVVFSQGDTFVAPAILLEGVVDPTGAGDTFAGGMAGALANLDDTSASSLRYAAMVGTCMASFCVEAFGPGRTSQIDTSLLRDRMERYVRQIRVPEQNLNL